MLQLFSFDLCCLLDPGATLSFVTPVVAIRFEILPDIIDDAFLVFALVGDTVVVMRVYKRRPISLPNRVTLVNLIKHNMTDFDIILGIN